MSFPDCRAVIDTCLFILPNIFLVQAAVKEKGYRAISPQRRELAREGLNGVRKLFKKELKFLNHTVQVLDTVELSDKFLPLFASAPEMT